MLDDVSQVQRTQSKQIQALDERTTQMQHAIDADRATTEGLAARISQLEQSQSRTNSSAASSRAGGSTTSRGPPSDPYASDRTILRVSTSSTVSLQAMQTAIGPLIERSAVPPKDVELHGSQMGRAFTLRQRPGARGNAEDVVNAIMAARRLANGEWANITIATPYGTTLPVYIERDKSYSQKKTAFHLVRVARTLRAAFTSKSFEVARSAGIVTHDWREIAQVRFNPDIIAVDVEWNDEAIGQLGGDGDTIRAAYQAMLRTPRTASVGSRG